MAGQGRARVLAGFGPELMCDALDRLYSELLGPPGGGRPNTAADADEAVGLRRLA